MAYFGSKWSFLLKIGNFCLINVFLGDFWMKTHEKRVIWSVHTQSGIVKVWLKNHMLNDYENNDVLVTK